MLEYNIVNYTLLPTHSAKKQRGSATQPCAFLSQLQRQVSCLCHQTHSQNRCINRRLRKTRNSLHFQAVPAAHRQERSHFVSKRTSRRTGRQVQHSCCLPVTLLSPLRPRRHLPRSRAARPGLHMVKPSPAFHRRTLHPGGDCRCGHRVIPTAALPL